MIGFVFRLAFKLIFVIVVVAAVAFIYFLYSTGQLPYVQDAVENTKVAGSVKAAFAVHRDLSNRPIHVSADDGVVTLSGRVLSEEERGAAVDIAASVIGVEEVVDRFDIDPAIAEGGGEAGSKSLGERLDDAALLAKIRTALHLDREIRRLELDVQVSSGEVVLRGSVPNEALKERVRARVASVDGVESLLDELVVPN